MKKTMRKGVIFDLDGTLLDSIQDIAASMNETLTQNALPTHTLDEYRSFIGNGVAVLTRRSVGENADDETFERVRKQYSAYYAAHADVFTRPFDGIHEALGALREEYALTILSNKGDSDVKALADKYFTGIFTAALGVGEGCRVKPAPDLVYATEKQLGLSAEDLVFVGDSPVDIETAHNAGLRCVGVTWGYRDRDVLEQAGADALCDRPEGLYPVIRSLLPPRGFFCDLSDEKMMDEVHRARALCQKLNRLPVNDKKRRMKVLNKLLGHLGEGADINPPFTCDFGSHISIGKNFFCNYRCLILDSAEVKIGDNCLFAPDVSLYTAAHPIELQGRLDNIGTARPITVGNGVWIGGRSVILGGVTIGDNAVIGAGSVVTHDIPANAVVAGNPARVLYYVDNTGKKG